MQFLSQNRCILLCILLLLSRSFGRPPRGNLNNINNRTNKTDETARKQRLRNEFDWRAYLELYPDLANHFASRDEAFFHYMKFGRKEGRKFPKIFPNRPGFDDSNKKLQNFIQRVEAKNIPPHERTFIIYFVGVSNFKHSLEVSVNNAKLFANAVQQDSASDSKNFYWFNVIGGVDNLLRAYFPLDQHNVADVDWTLTPSESFLHFRTVGLMKHILENKFGAVLFLNQDLRGPFLFHEQGAWIEHYRKILYNDHNIGLVGPTISCEKSPHVQNYMFMIKSELVPPILAEFSKFRKFDDKEAASTRYNIGLTRVVQSTGYNISSLLYSHRTNKVAFDGTCLSKPQETAVTSLDPTRWCDLKAEEVLFFRWGADVLQVGYLCEAMKTYMSSLLFQLKEQFPAMGLIYPETLRGGDLWHLYKDYDHEMYADAIQKAKPRKIVAGELKDKVCLMVRTCWLHDIKKSRPVVETTVEVGIDGIVNSLMRQTDPNWEAFFFITDDRPFDARLQEILGKYDDPRITFVDVPLKYRPAYTALDAGYTSTDFVLKYLVKRDDCRWISATNADNIYGTEVVESVRRVLADPKPRDMDRWPPDMVLTPLDSRNFPEQDYRKRGSKSSWDENCVGMVAKFSLHELGYTVQPRPYVAKVDLAAVFFSRPKLFAENIFFGNFSDPSRFPCKGCQDGYFTEYLSRGRLWSYRRVAIDGMKSIVFHGPSPTWCLAGGNVWFDHPDVGSVRCYSQETVDAIRALDNPTNSIFDWKFFEENDRICLRFSNLGFLKNANG